MATGGNKTQRIDIIDKIDPRTTARAAQKGTLYRYIPESGDPELLIKNDDGYTTNWAPVGGGGSMPSTFVTAASTANVNIAAAPATLDGIVYTTVLLKNQTDPSENGVYDYNGTGQPLTRTAGWDTADSFVPGRSVFVDQGNTQANTLWANANAVADLGTDPITFIEVTAVDFMLRNFSNAEASTVAIDMGNHKITNLATPTAGTDAVNKNYADSLIVPPTGTPNTLAYFNDDGDLSDNATAKFDDAANSMAFGGEIGGGTLISTAAGSLARGRANTGSITASGVGSLAVGITLTTGSILANGIGAIASGVAQDTGLIHASAGGSIAIGAANGADSILSASNNGARAFGIASGGGSITASGAGALAQGSADTTSIILAEGDASTAAGVVSDSSTITVSPLGAGATAFGLAATGGTIRTSNGGAFAHGQAEGADSIITADGEGSVAFGYALSGADISAENSGAFAFGYAVGKSLDASGLGSFAGGHAVTANVSAVGIAAFAMGDGVEATGNYSTAFGFGMQTAAYASFVIGRFGHLTGNTGAWIATDPVFAIGNGANAGAPATAYRIDKDGRQTTKASQVRRLTVVAGDYAVIARLDDKVVCQDTGGGAHTLTLPAGEQGLTFSLGQSDTNTAIYTIAATGADILDANIQSIFNTNQPVSVTYDLTTTKWYAI